MNCQEDLIVHIASSFQNFRNNLNLMNKGYKKHFLNANGHLSEGIRDNENKNIKGS